MFSASFENIFFGPLFPSNLERTVRIQVLCLLLVIDEITLFFFFFAMPSGLQDLTWGLTRDQTSPLGSESAGS